MASYVAVLSITVGGFLCAFSLPARGSAANSSADSLCTLQDSVVGLSEQKAPSDHSELPQTKPSERDRKTAQEKREATGPVSSVGGDVTSPKLVYKVEPEYPEEARRAHFQGTVVLYVVVDEKGLPRDLKVVRPLGLGLDEKAVEAVTKWRFKPGYKDGRPVAVVATIEVNFRLLQDFDSLLRRANQGDVAAQFELALMCELGQGTPQDYGAAFKWYREAAERGLPAAQNNLARMYEKGYGVAQDYSRAMKWYRKAADGGNAVAQSNLGQVYEEGRGVAQDYGPALKWYGKAAEQGLAQAQFHLGRIYSAGRAVPQDYSQAIGYYLRAAEQGFPAAQYAVGLMFAEGQGALQDRVSAQMWFELAVLGPDVEVRGMAATARAAMAKSMTREEIDEARRLAKEWHPRKP